MEEFDVVCPKCGALAGEGCKHPSGRATKHPHPERTQAAHMKQARERQFPSRDGKPGEVWTDSAMGEAKRIIPDGFRQRVQFVTDDNIISVYYDTDGQLVVNADRSFNIELGSSNWIKIRTR